jgi:hypothetical protein
LPAEVPLLANQAYWLEIEQVGDAASWFRWEFSATPPLDGQAFNNPIVGEWVHTQSITANAAFQLLTIPEPHFLSPVAILIVAARRRRRVR